MTEANVQTQIIERDLAKLGDRFDRHLEIYAQNGKELASLKTAVDNVAIKVDDNRMAEVSNAQKINRINVDLSKLSVRVGTYAAIGSAITSAIVVSIVEVLIV